MADMTIDEATADTSVTGVEKIPASDGGTAKSITTAQLRNFVLAAFADSSAADTISLSDDGVYIKQGGETKRLTGTAFAQAVIGYACSLAGIVGPNGNEIFVIDDSGTKKTITLAQITAYITANGADFFTSLGNSDPLAASDLAMVKQGGTVKKCSLSSIAAYVLSTFADFLTNSYNVLNVQTSDKIAVVSGGTTKWMTVAQLAASLATGATVPSTTTAGNVPTYTDAAGSLGTGLAVQTSVRAQGTADNNSLPTEAAVRAAINDATSGFGSGDVKGPGSQTTGNIPTWSSTSKTLTDGKAVQTSVRASGSAVDGAIPTEKAVRSAIDAEATARATAVAGEATARAAAITEAVANFVAAPLSTTQNKLPQWDSTQKKLKDGLTVVTSIDATGADTNVPTEKAVRDAIADATAGAGTGDVKGPAATTEGKLPTWDSTQKKLADGKLVQTSVRASAIASDGAIPTEKAVRDAIVAEATARGTALADKVAAPTSTTQDKIPQWDSTSKKLKDGLTLATSIGSTGSDGKVPTEKAVRDAIDEASGVAGPVSTTPGKVPIWDEAEKTLADGLTVQTSVRNNAGASNTAIPTEKAVRDAVDAKVAAPVSHTENCIPTWGAGNELKAGKTVVTTLASNGSNDNVPTEKAVRDALPVLATTSAAGLMSAEDKVKLDGMVNTSAVEEVGDTGLVDADQITVLKGGTTWKKSLLTRLWTWIIGKLSTFRIDDLMEGEDNTDLDTSTARHGLCPKLSGDTDEFLRGDGTFATPTGSEDFTGDSGSGGTHGLVPAPASGDASTKFLKADGTWAVPPSAAGVDIPGSTAVAAAADADALICYAASANAYRKMTLAQVAALVMGKKRFDNIFIPAAAMVPSATNGATAGAIEFSNVKRDTLAFSNSTVQGAEFSLVMPEDWDKGKFRAKMLWTAHDATKAEAGEMVGWAIGAYSSPDEGAITTAPTNFATVTDNLSQVNELHRTGATGQITPDGTAGDGNLVHFVVRRNVSAEASNPMDTEALLLGVWLQFARTADVTEEWS